MTDFQTGAGEELRIVLTDEQDTSSVTDMTVLPHSGNPTGPNKPYSRGPTDEVNSDLQIQDNPVRGFTVPFSYDGLWRYGIHDIPLQMVMGSAWSAAVSITGTDIASAATGNKFTSVTATKFAAFTAQVPCPVWILRDGATPLATYAIATAVEDTETTLVIGDGTAGDDFGVTLTVVAASDNVTIMHSGVLKNGSTAYWAIVERANADVGLYYAGYGMMCTNYDFKAQKGQDPGASFQFMGRDANDATSTFGTGTETAAGTFSAFNSGADLVYFGENGLFAAMDPTDAAIGWLPSQVNLSVSSAATPIDPMGINGPYANVKDTVTLSGNFSLFTTDAARVIRQRQVTNADSSLCWVNQKTVGAVTNAYFHWLPRIQYNTAEPGGGGQGGVSTLNYPFSVAKDQTHLISYAIARFAAVPLS